MDASRRDFLRARRDSPPVRGSAAARIARIGSACLAQRRVECRVCGECCEQRAIRFAPQHGGVAMPLVDVARCTGCGDCAARCPTTAITLEPTA